MCLSCAGLSREREIECERFRERVVRTEERRFLLFIVLGFLASLYFHQFLLHGSKTRG